MPTQAFEYARITVVMPDRTVVVDGVGYRCDFEAPGDIHAIQWRTFAGGKPGYIEGAVGGGPSREFDDYAVLLPYVAAWLAARASAEAEAAKARAQQEAQKRAVEDAAAAAKARQQDLQPLMDALTGLGGTDHEILKAMEAKLAEESALPPDLVAQRRAWREKARNEKRRLRAAGIVGM